ncbi:MAG TPA: AAA family ATPase [Micropepsaceae bacterium]|nr:AAA family ATPase [Micropepsaceae bacterium]
MNERPSPTASSPVAIPRLQAMVFVRDRDSEGVIRQSLSDLGIADAQYTNGDIDTAIATLAQRSSPRLLIVDISGVHDPSARINALAEVCEPGVGVVVVGESNDIRLYRDLKQGGIVEYFFKPLVSNPLGLTFQSVLTGGPGPRVTRTGKLVFVIGARGGDGATTIATNTARHLADNGMRRVLYLDLDLQFGDAALQFDATPSHALREALEHPERVDDLFLQRGVTQITERLDLMAAQEPLNESVTLNDEAVLTLLGNLIHRYRYIFVDLPCLLAPSLLRVLTLPSVLLLVSTASLSAARDVARWRQQIGPNTPERITLHVLNKNGADASLPLKEFIGAVGQPPDLVVPYEREIGLSSNLGVAEVRKCASFQRSLAPLFRHLTGEGEAASPSFLKRIFG